MTYSAKRSVATTISVAAALALLYFVQSKNPLGGMVIDAQAFWIISVMGAVILAGLILSIYYNYKAMEERRRK